MDTQDGTSREDGLILEGLHGNAWVGGTQRIYRWGDWGLSIINGQALHVDQFHSEAAVLRFTGKETNAFDLDYSTPLTADVEVFVSAEEEERFIEKAREYFLQKTQ